MKVLIVDDSTALVQRLAASLTELAGVEIVGNAASVPDALQKIHRLQPEVVVLDIRMPGGTGIEVLESLKQSPAAPIVIMLSNYSDPPYRRRCLQSGAQFFFDKSAEFHKVAEVLRALIGGPAA